MGKSITSGNKTMLRAVNLPLSMTSQHFYLLVSMERAVTFLLHQLLPP